MTKCLDYNYFLPLHYYYINLEKKKDSSLPLQVAERQGRFLSKFMNSGFDENKTGPFTFESMGMLAYIGSYEALTDTPQMKIKG